jgi:hypothetical protein
MPITVSSALSHYDSFAVTLFQKQYRVETARLAGWDYSAAGWYFITICAKDKKCTLGSMTDGQVVLSRAGRIAEYELSALLAVKLLD